MAVELFFRSSGFCLSPGKLDAQRVSAEREVLQSSVMPPLEECVTYPLISIDALCLLQSLALWVIVAWLAFPVLHIVKNVLIGLLWKGLTST